MDDAAVDFAPYFTARSGTLGVDESMMQSAYELRYQVYCLECRFLEAEDYPDRQETDAYDDDSAHFFSHNTNNELVGYVRLVPPDSNGKFPWESYCKQLVPGAVIPTREESAEVSRLMVRQDYRRRRGDTLAGVTFVDDKNIDPAASRRSDSPQILLALYRQMYQHSVKVGIRYWYAAMERPLARSLQRLDFAFRQVGAETDYFGPVAPYLADIREFEERLARSNPELLAWMQRPDRNNS